MIENDLSRKTFIKIMAASLVVIPTIDVGRMLIQSTITSNQANIPHPGVGYDQVYDAKNKIDQFAQYDAKDQIVQAAQQGQASVTINIPQTIIDGEETISEDQQNIKVKQQATSSIFPPAELKIDVGAAIVGAILLPIAEKISRQSKVEKTSP